MLDPCNGSLLGRRLQRQVYVERVLDPVTGEEVCFEHRQDVTEAPDGTVEKTLALDLSMTSCGHARRPGEPVVSCVDCSRGAGHMVFVCAQCSVTCGYCGKAACQKHSRPGGDGLRYCSRSCARKAKKLRESAASNEGTQGESLVRTLARWW